LIGTSTFQRPQSSWFSALAPDNPEPNFTDKSAFCLQFWSIRPHSFHPTLLEKQFQ
jgi:hypothetical protein